MSTGTLQETPFTNLPQSVLGLESAGDYLFAVDASGAWERFYSFDASGTMVDSVEWRHASSEYLWNPVTERIYHFRSGTSPNDIEWSELSSTTGLLGSKGDSPYHSSGYAAAPLHFDPAGQLLLTGGGKLHDAYSLAELNYLSNEITDAAWTGDTLHTIAAVDGNAVLQTWSDNYELLEENSIFDALDTRILAYGAHLVAIEMAASGGLTSQYSISQRTLTTTGCLTSKITAPTPPMPIKTIMMAMSLATPVTMIPTTTASPTQTNSQWDWIPLTVPMPRKTWTQTVTAI